MNWKNNAKLAVLTCENQAKIHYLMPIRNMLYDSLSYTDQAKHLWESHSKDQKMPSEEEFLSHFYKDDYLIPVITLVFYYGEKEWDAAIDLYDMFSPDNQILQNISLQKYISNYRINLIDGNNINDINRFQSDLQQIFGMLQCKKDKKKLQNYIQQNETYFKNIDMNTYQAFAELLHSEELMKKAAESASRKERLDMCQALKELYQDGVNQGISQGITSLIEATQEFGHTKEDAVFKIMEKFHLDRPSAIENVEKYWKTP